MRETIAPETRSSRIDYLDNLRVFLTALVVCHHQAIAFGAPGGWYYIVTAPKDIPSIALMTMFVAVNQAFFMSLFFFIAAYFTRMSLLKKDMPAFARDRAIRLGIPLVVYFLVLNPSVAYLARLFSGRTDAGYFAFMRHSAADCFGPGPMWFVLSLILFTAAYMAFGVVCRDTHAKRRVSPPGDKRVLAFVLLVGGFTFLVRLVCPVGVGFLGLQFGYFPLYICMFSIGIAACGNTWLDQLGTARANRWFRTAIACILALPAVLWLGGAFEGNGDSFRGGIAWQAYAYSAWEPFLCVGISMKLLVLFRERFNRANAITARLSKSAYTVYILHPFFVVAATRLARDLPLPPLAIVLLVCPLVLAVAFACADVVRRAPLLNKVL